MKNIIFIDVETTEVQELQRLVNEIGNQDIIHLFGGENIPKIKREVVDRLVRYPNTILHVLKKTGNKVAEFQIIALLSALLTSMSNVEFQIYSTSVPLKSALEYIQTDCNPLRKCNLRLVTSNTKQSIAF